MDVDIQSLYAMKFCRSTDQIWVSRWIQFWPWFLPTCLNEVKPQLKHTQYLTRLNQSDWYVYDRRFKQWYITCQHVLHAGGLACVGLLVPSNCLHGNDYLLVKRKLYMCSAAPSHVLSQSPHKHTNVSGQQTTPPSEFQRKRQRFQGSHHSGSWCPDVTLFQGPLRCTSSWITIFLHLSCQIAKTHDTYLISHTTSLAASVSGTFLDPSWMIIRKADPALQPTSHKVGCVVYIQLGFISHCDS